MSAACDRTQNHIAVGPLDPLEHRCLFRIARSHRQTGAFVFYFDVGIAWHTKSSVRTLKTFEEEATACGTSGVHQEVGLQLGEIGGADPDKTFRAPLVQTKLFIFIGKRCGTFCGPRGFRGIGRPNCARLGDLGAEQIEFCVFSPQPLELHPPIQVALVHAVVALTLGIPWPEFRIQQSGTIRSRLHRRNGGLNAGLAFVPMMRKGAVVPSHPIGFEKIDAKRWVPGETHK